MKVYPNYCLDAYSINMSSRAVRVVVDNVPHLFNLNHVNKVSIVKNTLKFYFSVSKEIVGMSVMGSGFLHGNSLHSVEVKYTSEEEAKIAFEEVATLM